MQNYTYDLIETRQYRLTVEAENEHDAYDAVYDNYYEGLYDEALEEHPCVMEIYPVQDGEEVR